MPNTASMPHNEEGEFELVLGNKELLSVLFIVVVLLGVFFAMGYVVGRNSSPVDTARRSEAYVPPAAPAERAPAPTSAVQTTTAPPAAAASAETAAPEPAVETAPAPAPENAPVVLAQPQPGQMFLQVSAVAKPEADILVDLLTKKGFHAMVAAGPNESLYRVLVGPAKDTTDLGKMKGDLEQAGFKSIVRKY